MSEGGLLQQISDLYSRVQRLQEQLAITERARDANLQSAITRQETAIKLQADVFRLERILREDHARRERLLEQAVEQAQRVFTLEQEAVHLRARLEGAQKPQRSDAPLNCLKLLLGRVAEGRLTSVYYKADLDLWFARRTYTNTRGEPCTHQACAATPLGLLLDVERDERDFGWR